MKSRWLIGAGVVLSAALIYLLLPSRSQVSIESRFLRDKLLLGQMGQALINFSKDNAGAYPATLDLLRDRYIRNYDDTLALYHSDEGYLMYSPPPAESAGIQDGSRVLLILYRKYGCFIFSADGKISPLAINSPGFAIIGVQPVAEGQTVVH